MFGNKRVFKFAIGTLALGLAVAIALPAQAQQRRSGGNFFFNLFGGGGSGPYYQQRPYQSEGPAQQTDYSRAPAAKKPDPKIVPTTTIAVMGDSMADWLAYGLEDAFSDSPEIAVVRDAKRGSGLLRYEYKSDLDWWHAARDILSREKADYVVMMLGLSDRQNISEKDAAKQAEKDEADKKPGDQNQDQSDDNESSIISPEPQGKKVPNGVIEFRSDKWAEIYGRRVDDTIAALKSKGVPVFWVGLPAIRGPKATADAVYLNDLYRARAERAGAIYVDVWDGFVDEAGKFTTQGPDFEGQVRRLRSWDGVYFTKAGARKLAHYVEREIRRYMSNHAVPVALPMGPVGPAPEAKSTARPLAGPVLPLTVTPTNSDELAGGASAQPAHSDAIATNVLVKGDAIAAPAGRADDFTWPRSSAAPVTAVSAAASAAVELEPAPKAVPKADIRTNAKSGPSPIPSPSPRRTAKPRPRMPRPLRTPRKRSSPRKRSASSPRKSGRSRRSRSTPRRARCARRRSIRSPISSGGKPGRSF